MSVFLSFCLSVSACKSRLSASSYIVICDLSVSNTYPSFPHKQMDSRKQNIEHEMCLTFSTNLFEIFLILGRIKRDIIFSSRKVPVIHARFYSNMKFGDRFSKYPKISNFMKINPVGAELFHSDAQA
jgi:hypothetical protein